MNRLPDATVAIVLSLAYALQGALLFHQQTLSASDTRRLIFATATLSLIGGFAWMERRWLNSHADMLLLMGGFGGLGMLLGSLAEGSPSCHIGNMHFFSFMTAGMLLGGFLPAAFLSRCLLTARIQGRFLAVIAFDSTGMWMGMAFPLWTLSALGLGPPPRELLHPLLATGMLSGMLTTMAFRTLWLRSLDRFSLLFATFLSKKQPQSFGAGRAKVRNS